MSHAPLGIGLLLSFWLAWPTTLAAETQELLLWPHGAPQAKGDTYRDKPKLIASPLEGEAGLSAAVVICPGGGYGHLAMDHEGHEIAAWLNSLGVAAFICDYRHRGKGYGHPAPLEDAQRALRTVRSRAAEWHIDPERVGILGFSAGGHLASTAATHFDSGDPDSQDLVARQSCRPDFAILCYPVIALGEPYTHRGSQHNLLGKNAQPELVQSLSNEKQVSEDTPPTFLWHTHGDRGVPAENSVRYYLACLRHNVPAELHIYEQGGHGVGLAKQVPGTADWPHRCAEWMRTRALIE